jgi:Ca2+-binding EF-hand superfamily protein
MIGDLQRRKASHYFALIDEDNNGLVEADDFELRAERLAETRDITDPDEKAALRKRVMSWWEHLCALADTDDDDRVTREEWQTYWEALQTSVDQGGETKKRTLQSLERAARGTFRAMNRADGGVVTEAEYLDWLVAWNVEPERAAFDRLDRDDTGGLTEEDLIQAVKEFYLSNDPDAPGNVLYGQLPT